ncbi:MAG: YigZ family protein [Desulfobacterales bacterium]
MLSANKKERKNRMYKIPATLYRTEQTIKRSKFIATVAHASTTEDAKTFISAIKCEFQDASHNCWAYVAGPPGDTARVGMSDDGEPHGTAGKPILSVLLHSEIGEIVAVVARYFGGTKLGTGGLVRAYSSSVKNAIAGLSVKEKRDVLSLTVTFDYSKLTAVKLLIKSFGCEIIEENYEADVSLKIVLPKTNKDSFTRAITDLMRGEILITK